ncbi:MAG: hypothetical protein RL553_100 [Planctomycetota bacterium]|jgi:hypothetical protein
MKTISIIFFLVIATLTTAQELKPAMDIKLKGKVGDFQIKLVFCPEGKLLKRDPETSKEVIDMKSFYLAETEITTSQLITLMGIDFTEENIKVLNQLNPELRESYKPYFAKDSKFPLLYVTPKQAIDFCLELQRQYEDQIIQGKIDIENIGFYIPTHDQWVYAARGTTTEEEVKNRPHFFQWIDNDKISEADKADLKSIWSKINGEGELLFKQNQIMKIVRHPESFKDEMHVKRFLKWTLEQINGDDWDNDNLRPALKSPKNNWGIRGIHDNGSEWTIKSTQDERLNFWKNASSKIESLNLILAGPTLGDSYSPSSTKLGQLNKFSLWGGPKLGGSDFTELTPLKYTSDFDIMEAKPAFRVCAERNLTDHWLLSFREDLWSSEPIESTKTRFLEKQMRLKALVPDNHESHFFAKYFLELLESRTDKTPLLTQNINNFTTSLANNSSASGSKISKKIKLDLDSETPAGTLGSLASSAPTKNTNPDKDFFELLAKTSAK